MGHGFAVGVGELGVQVREVIFVFGGFFATVFGFGEPVELVVGVFARAGTVSHDGPLAIFVVFVFNGRRFPVRVAYCRQTVSRIIAVGSTAFLSIGDLTYLASSGVFG